VLTWSVIELGKTAGESAAEAHGVARRGAGSGSRSHHAESENLGVHCGEVALCAG